MKILRTLGELSLHLQTVDTTLGAFADTGFLYAISYEDDRSFNKANDVLDTLSEQKVPIFANVISRMEFVDLIFRKQVTDGCIQLFGKLKKESFGEPIFNILKDIRDKDTAARRKNQ